MHANNQVATYRFMHYAYLSIYHAYSSMCYAHINIYCAYTKHTVRLLRRAIAVSCTLMHPHAASHIATHATHIDILTEHIVHTMNHIPVVWPYLVYRVYARGSPHIISQTSAHSIFANDIADVLQYWTHIACATPYTPCRNVHIAALQSASSESRLFRARAVLTMARGL